MCLKVSIELNMGGKTGSLTGLVVFVIHVGFFSLTKEQLFYKPVDFYVWWQ